MDYESDSVFSSHDEDPVIRGRWEDNFSMPATYKQAFKTLLVNSLPLMITYFALFSTKNVALHYLRDTNDIPLISAVAVAFTLMNVLCIAIFIALNIGFVSKASQAFSTKNPRLIGLYLHNALIINIILFIPCALLMIFSDKVCLMFRFDTHIVGHISYLLTLCLPGLFFLMLFTTFTGYLNACNIFFAPAIIQVISSIVFWATSYLFINTNKWDLVGVSLSFNLMEVVAAGLLFLYIKIRDPVPGSFFWFSRTSFYGLWEFFKYELAVGSMIFLEWIAAEIVFLFAAALSPEQLLGLAIAYNNLSIIYAIPTALGDTLIRFMATAMVEKNVDSARKFLRAGLIIVIVALLIITPLYYVFTENIALFYITDPITVEITARIMVMYIFLFSGDFVQLILFSGLRAIGKEKSGAIFMIICYYFGALPISYYLCFVEKQQVYGLVIGPIVAVYLIIIGLVVIYQRFSWEEQVAVMEQNVSVDRRKHVLIEDERMRNEPLL